MYRAPRARVLLKKIRCFSPLHRSGVSSAYSAYLAHTAHTSQSVQLSRSTRDTGECIDNKFESVVDFDLRPFRYGDRSRG